MTKEGDDGGLTVVIVPDGSGVNRSFRVGARLRRWIPSLVAVAAVLVAGFVVSWALFARHALRAPVLEREVATLRSEVAQVAELERQLGALEAQYARVRSLFGASGESRGSADLWLPPAGSGGAIGSAEVVDGSPPTSWPLTEGGFVTRTLLEGGDAVHPGIDIAVPMDSYIRAAGAGTVVEAGVDDVYGWALVIDHGGGLSSRYAHASRLLVEKGRVVRRNEVVALSGSSGRSTAPHLHFEILQDGRPVDPLELVEPG